MRPCKCLLSDTQEHVSKIHYTNTYTHTYALSRARGPVTQAAGFCAGDLLAEMLTRQHK